MNLKAPGKQNSLWWVAAALAAVCAAATVGLIVYRNGGIFTYYGDYNCQQIDFYMHAHEMVKTGQIGWDWITDLGVNFIGSYSFYLLFSPFFWLTIPFETAAVPYLMAPLFVLKFMTCAVTSYFFFERFVKDKAFAVIGSLLYAFSGYCIYNVFFNHFLDVVAFYPLILIGLEELICEDRRGLFAVGVFINAVVNYWFFIGEVVFTVIYFLVRITDRRIENKLQCFVKALAESVIGLMCAAVVVLPSVMAIWDNPRVGSGNYINGWNMWLYYSEQRFPAIIASFFFPPDLPAKQNMFPSQGAQWASMAGWLPLFGMTGVIAFMRNHPKSWLSKLIWVLSAFALVPVLNSFFLLFNDSYYARWFYMFDLVLILATVFSVEKMTDPAEENAFDYKKGIIPAAVVTFLTGAALLFTPVYDDGEWTYGITYNSEWFVRSFIFAGASVVLVYVIWRLRLRRFIKPVLVFLTAAVCAAYGAVYVNLGYTYANDHDEIIDEAVGLSTKMEIPDKDSGFVRTDFYECFENMGLYWEMPSIRCFHSIVPPSVMEFYPEVGVKRDVSSKPDPELFGLRAFLSVKYLYAQESEMSDGYVPVSGFEYLRTENGYNIYENENFIPMGYTFENYITEDEFLDIEEGERHKVLVKALVLKPSQILTYRKYLNHLYSYDDYIDYENFAAECGKRSDSAAVSFECDSKGFTSRIYLPRDNLVFYSVPYESGWTAYVDGEEAAIEKVDTGFMAVFCEKGTHTVEFRYETPGLKIGAIMSGIAIIGLVVYIVRCRHIKKVMMDHLLIDDYYNEHQNEEASDDEDLTLEEDLSIIRKPEETPEYHEYMGPEEKIYPDL